MHRLQVTSPCLGKFCWLLSINTASILLFDKNRRGKQASTGGSSARCAGEHSWTGEREDDKKKTTEKKTAGEQNGPSRPAQPGAVLRTWPGYSVLISRRKRRAVQNCSNLSFTGGSDPS